MKTLIFVYFALFILIASACQQGTGEASLTGTNGDCVTNPASCTSNIYQQNNGYAPYGGGNSTPFNYYNNSAYLCNCPYGSIPTYNSYAGLGCIRSASYSAGLSAGFYGYLYLGWGINQEWSRMPQLYRYNYNSSSTCYNGAVQSCVVGQANNCPSGFACRQTGAQSNLGLCVTPYR